jgi:hypothetical protein
MGSGSSRAEVAGQDYSPAAAPARQILVQPSSTPQKLSKHIFVADDPDDPDGSAAITLTTAPAAGTEVETSQAIADLYRQVGALTATVRALEAELSQQRTRGGGASRGRAATMGALEEKSRVCSAPASTRAEFLEERWLPFVAELKGEMRAARARAIGGFSPEEILPPQVTARHPSL